MNLAQQICSLLQERLDRLTQESMDEQGGAAGYILARSNALALLAAEMESVGPAWASFIMDEHKRLNQQAEAAVELAGPVAGTA